MENTGNYGQNDIGLGDSPDKVNEQDIGDGGIPWK
jgi:hypothetical protein